MVPNNIHLPNLAKNLPPEVKKIFNIFLNQGDEIRLVGGCVRDLLIEKKVNELISIHNTKSNEELQAMSSNENWTYEAREATKRILISRTIN